MKVNELMVGDLVRVTEDVCIKKGTIVEIVGIDATRTLPKHGLVGCTLCTPLNHDDNLYGGYGGVWTAFLEPILITKTILEKNGFKKEDDDCYLWNESLERIIWFEGGYTVLTSVRCDRMYEGHCYDVHELQHALEICGVNKEIVL